MDTSKTIVPAMETAVLIETLRAKAAGIVGAALGAKPLVGFQTGSLGNFPYYWTSSRNLNFNALTYDWINANLAANSSPVSQAEGSTFTSQFVTALESISYSLSTDDQNELNEGAKKATQQQTALLNNWKNAFGKLPDPEGHGEVIDAILGTIQTEWSSKSPLTLMDIRNARNLDRLLDKAPSAGQPILPVLTNYLNAISSTLSLRNSVALNNRFLIDAQLALEDPSKGNGGLELSNDKLVPAYRVATPLAEILNGLDPQANKNEVKLGLTITRTSKSEFKVEITGGTSFTVPVLSFFKLNVGGKANYFQEDIVSRTESIKIEMVYSGPTLVQFGPVPFEKTGGTSSWFFMQAIEDAVKNTGEDVSGYKFSPVPNIDFGKSGPFGFLTACAIANYPSVKITVESADFKSIETEFKQSAKVGISFLGIPFGINGNESSYSSDITTDASKNSISITLDPPKELVAGTADESSGWILGVATEYPGA